MNFLEIQPEKCREPFELKRLKLPFYDVKAFKRAMFFDPTEIYKRISDLLNPYKRYQSISIGIVFPQIDKPICDCGCGKKLKGRQRRWANQDCSTFAYYVTSIISGQPSTIYAFITAYYGFGCIECKSEGIEIDHVVGIKHGGGRCWLSNYRPLCTICHQKKTNKDFGWKKENKLLKAQMKLELN